ncbi:MAG: 50S ribosomal protein L24 [Blastochloris sp.]|nr:50S ribosomal protein L24 [Blastochloris sp.]
MKKTADITVPRRYHVKKNDQVRVISGAHKGKEGKVLQILTKKARVIVEGVHMIKKAVRPTQINPKGGFEEKEGSIHVSNLKVLASGEKPDKASKAAKSKE